MKRKMRILIVEDEYAIDEGVLCCLNDLDYEIIKTVFHSQAALDFLVDVNIDIVLIDTNLNDDLSGYQLAEIIKCDFHIPFILLNSTGKHVCIEKIREEDPNVSVLEYPTLKQMQISLALAVNMKENLDLHLQEEKQ